MRGRTFIGVEGGGSDGLFGWVIIKVVNIYCVKADSDRNEIHYRTHLLPFTRCDRGATQHIPIWQSLAYLVWTPDSILRFAIFANILHICAI